MRRRFTRIEGFGICNITASNVQPSRSNATLVKICSAWLSSGVNTMANFRVSAQPAGTSSKDGQATWRMLETQWKTLTYEAAEAEILDAEERVKMKRGATEMDRLVCAMGPKVLRRKKDALNAQPSFVLFADSPNIIALDQCENLDRVVVLQWQVEDGLLLRYPLLHWIEEQHYRTRMLVITGDSDKGKTQVAKSMLSSLSDELQVDLYPKPYSIVVQTVEGLASAAAGGWCQEWVGILLDEIRPGQARGTRPPMTPDEVKKLCSIDIQGTIDARNRDILLSVSQPRINTANAMNPSEWHPVLPSNLFRVDGAARMAMHPDAKAIGKRIAWAQVDVSLIPQAMRDAYHRRR